VNKCGTGDRTQKSIWFKTDEQLEEEKRLRELELNPIRLYGWQGEAKLFGYQIDTKKKSHSAAVVKQNDDGGYFVRLRDPKTREWLQADLGPELLENYTRCFAKEDHHSGLTFAIMGDDMREGIFQHVCARLQIVSWREHYRVNKDGNMLLVLPPDIDLKKEESDAKKYALMDAVQKRKERKRMKERQRRKEAERDGMGLLENVLNDAVEKEEGVSDVSSELSDVSSEHNIYGDADSSVNSDADEMDEEEEVYITDDESYEDDAFNCDICDKRMLSNAPGSTRYFSDSLFDYDLCRECWLTFPANASEDVLKKLSRSMQSVWSCAKVTENGKRELVEGLLRPPPARTENLEGLEDYIAQLARELETGEKAVPREDAWVKPGYESEEIVSSEEEEEGEGEGEGV
jgi:hypothetical protein